MMKIQYINSDIRFEILKELQKHSAETVSQNRFLSTIRTSDGKKDIGTIRRCLEDLKKNELIDQFLNKSDGSIDFITALDTTSHSIKEAKTTDRFIDDVTTDGKIYHKIPELYLFSTLKGKITFIEWNKSIDESYNSRFRRKTYIWVFILSIIGATTGIISIIIKIFCY